MVVLAGGGFVSFERGRPVEWPNLTKVVGHHESDRASRKWPDYFRKWSDHFHLSGWRNWATSIDVELPVERGCGVEGLGRRDLQGFLARKTTTF